MNKLNLNLTVILGMMFSIIFISCEEQEREINLSDNEEQRQEVYQQILNDKELFNEFLTEMRENKPMMRNMYTRAHVESMMMNHPEVMDSVMVGVYAYMERDTMMLRNPQRRERMMRNMTHMMKRDTAMYREMQQRMQDGRMNNQ